MKELVPMDDYGIFANEKYEVMVDSRFVVFEKDVLKAIEDINNSGFSEEFKQHNFVPEQSYYFMTRDGFVALLMWCKEAEEIKNEYIKRFDELEEHHQLTIEMAKS